MYAPLVIKPSPPPFFMDLLATFAIGSAPSAAYAGIASVLLFVIVGVIAGPNLEKFDVDSKK